MNSSTSNYDNSKQIYDAPVHKIKKLSLSQDPPTTMTFTQQVKEEVCLIKDSAEDGIKTITREGLQHPRAVIFLLLWYIFSAGTIFLNKYILSFQNLDPYLFVWVFHPPSYYLVDQLCSNNLKSYIMCYPSF